MYAYLHPACGRPAWLTIDKPQVGVNFLSAKPLRIDHAPKDMAQGCTCESCGKNMFGQAGDVGNVVNYILWRMDNQPLIRRIANKSKTKLLLNSD